MIKKNQDSKKLYVTTYKNAYYNILRSLIEDIFFIDKNIQVNYYY